MPSRAITFLPKSDWTLLYYQDDETAESRPETSASRKGQSAGASRPVTGYGRKASAAPVPEPDLEPDDNLTENGGNGNYYFCSCVLRDYYDTI